MALPSSLRWVNRICGYILDYKEEILGDAKPVCELERVRLDIAGTEDGRRGLFANLGRRAKQVAVMSEGLVIYLMPDAVAALARDLFQPPTFHWVLNLASAGLLEMKQSVGSAMSAAAPVPLRAGGGSAILRGARMAAD